ncbi:hypothetical protein MKW98_002924 [Papaver atlanticum]|uniref:Endoplasmic reticulum resident protein 29 C-terminal domain-containing protein n=1 Tax=Papaver atlanticum TaxID=357466 RepID=A0AAD4T3C9_9MAGN|nr:hypothetical protein MKW98_002924 [Papaver atlanticum]
MEEEVEKLKDSSARYGKIYLKAAKSCLEKSSDYATKEMECLKRMLEKSIIGKFHSDKQAWLGTIKSAVSRGTLRISTMDWLDLKITFIRIVRCLFTPSWKVICSLCYTEQDVSFKFQWIISGHLSGIVGRSCLPGFATLFTSIWMLSLTNSYSTRTLICDSRLPENLLKENHS